MSSSSAKITAVSLVLAAIGCSPTPPGSVDHELLAFDVGACLVAGSACTVTAGNVTGTSGLGSGDDHVIAMTAGASIDVPLASPFVGAVLRDLAFGVNAISSDASGNSALDVTVTGGCALPLVVPDGLQRVEVDEGTWVPAPGAHLTIAVKSGRFEISYVVGRWDDPSSGAVLAPVCGPSSAQ